jgi:hypothetical protein
MGSPAAHLPGAHEAPEAHGPRSLSAPTTTRDATSGRWTPRERVARHVDRVRRLRRGAPTTCASAGRRALHQRRAAPRAAAVARPDRHRLADRRRRERPRPPPDATRVGPRPARPLRVEGTAFFFKQWGGRTPKSNGRELDGRTWDEMPREFAEWLADHAQVTGHSPPRDGTKALAALAASFAARRGEGYSLDDLKLASRGGHADDYRRESTATTTPRACCDRRRSTTSSSSAGAPTTTPAARHSQRSPRQPTGANARPKRSARRRASRDRRPAAHRRPCRSRAAPPCDVEPSRPSSAPRSSATASSSPSASTKASTPTASTATAPLIWRAIETLADHGDTIDTLTVAGAPRDHGHSSTRGGAPRSSAHGQPERQRRPLLRPPRRRCLAVAHPRRRPLRALAAADDRDEDAHAAAVARATDVITRSHLDPTPQGAGSGSSPRSTSRNSSRSRCRGQRSAAGSRCARRDDRLASWTHWGKSWVALELAAHAGSHDHQLASVWTNEMSEEEVIAATSSARPGSASDDVLDAPATPPTSRKPSSSCRSGCPVPRLAGRRDRPPHPARRAGAGRRRSLPPDPRHQRARGSPSTPSRC